MQKIQTAAELLRHDDARLQAVWIARKGGKTSRKLEAIATRKAVAEAVQIMGRRFSRWCDRKHAERCRAGRPLLGATPADYLRIRLDAYKAGKVAK